MFELKERKKKNPSLILNQKISMLLRFENMTRYPRVSKAVN